MRRAAELGRRRRRPARGSGGLVGAAGALLRADRRLALVPLAALALCSALVAAVAAAIPATLQAHERRYGSAYHTAGFGLPGSPPTFVTTLGPSWWTLALVAGACLTGAFALTLAVAVVAATTSQRLAGERPSLAGAAALAARRAPRLLAWSTFAAVVGTIDRLLGPRLRRRARREQPAVATWRRASWLALPVVVIEGRRPVRSLSRSMALIERTWGADAWCRSGLGLVTATLVAPALVAAVAAGPYGTAGIAVTAALASPAVAVALTLATITRTAAYIHATGGPTAGFEPAALAGAFRPRSRSRAAGSPGQGQVQLPGPVGYERLGGSTTSSSAPSSLSTTASSATSSPGTSTATVVAGCRSAESPRSPMAS
jgi:hypothetical protein